MLIISTAIFIAMSVFGSLGIQNKNIKGGIRVRNTCERRGPFIFH